MAGREVVVDVGGAVKWVFPDPALEPEADRAVALLLAIRGGEVEIIQPPHWLLEVIAVVSRLNPAISERALRLLDALELPVCDDLAVIERAVRIAVELQHHLFDTLYHSVALEQDAILVTADGRCARKAASRGRLVLLGDLAAG